MAHLQVVYPLATVSDVMTGWVVTITPTDSLLKARELMTSNRVSQLVVADDRKRPLAVVSKRDIARFLLDDVTTRSLGEMLVSEAYSDSIHMLRSDIRVLSAARLFDTENLSNSIVVNEKPLAGILTETDLAHFFAQKFPDQFKVDEFMISDFVFAKSSYPVVHVAHDIVFRQPSVPVIDEELVGIVTLTDLLSIRDKCLTGGRLSFGAKLGDEAALVTVKDLMTRNPVTTRTDTDLAQAAQIMITKGISSLPVIDSDSGVVGLLTKHDIVRALGRIGKSLNPEV